MKVKEIGEQGLLQHLFRFCPAHRVGDDGAVVDLAPGYRMVVTTDVLVDGVHFSDRTTPPHAVGWRAVAANLSDLAAMGASPVGITVGLSLMGETEVEWVESLYEGMSECLQPYETPIIGGDVVRSPVISLSITALGQVQPDRLCQRHTGQPGDRIVVTGVHGASRAGLECLLNQEWSTALSPGDRQRLIQAHQYPQPRLDVLPKLWDLDPQSIAGMDSSDGLADALEQICRASGVGAQIHLSKIPTAHGLTAVLSDEQIRHWAFYGGEDFELVLCLPPEVADRFVDQLGEDAAIIGELTFGDRLELLDRFDHEDKPNPNSTLDRRWGFQHFN